MPRLVLANRPSGCFCSGRPAAQGRLLCEAQFLCTPQQTYRLAGGGTQGQHADSGPAALRRRRRRRGCAPQPPSMHKGSFFSATQQPIQTLLNTKLLFFFSTSFAAVTQDLARYRLTQT